MKITINDFELAGAEYRELPAGLRIRTQPVIQTAGALRGTYVNHYDRGNKETVITFSVTREHDTIEEAELYILEHEANVPTRGLVVLESSAGNTTVRRWIQNAVVTVTDRSHIGKTSRHGYEIRGGQILIEDPT